ncbi:thioredoxin family protein [Desulfarculus baarsii]
MKRISLAGLIIAASFVLISCQAGNAQDTKKYLSPGMVTLVDLGADKCIPCKMMKPILEALKVQYQGKAAVVFIDVWENRAAAKDFGVRVIPTQIFFDAAGQEVHRHEGFLDKKSIEDQLAKMGVKAR